MNGCYTARRFYQKKMPIYTRSGDDGKTGIIGGRRILKNDLLIETLGANDELIAVLGLASLQSDSPATKQLLEKIQSDLFTLGTEISDPDKKLALKTIGAADSAFLEAEIDAREKMLPPITQFTLPGGTLFAAHAHITRTTCRRAERKLVALHGASPQNPELLKYLNRLSDLLFVLAREDVHAKGAKEVLWQYPKK